MPLVSARTPRERGAADPRESVSSRAFSLVFNRRGFRSSLSVGRDFAGRTASNNDAAEPRYHFHLRLTVHRDGGPTVIGRDAKTIPEIDSVSQRTYTRVRDSRSPPCNHVDCSRMVVCVSLYLILSKPPTTRVASPLRGARCIEARLYSQLASAVLHLTNVGSRMDNEREEARRKRVKTGERARDEISVSV